MEANDTPQYTVTPARSDAEIAACCECMRELRPQIDAGKFVARVREMQKENYHLAYIEDNGRVVAVAGYRFMHTLFGGDTIYVDDLVSLPSERSRGYGTALIDWLRDLARNRGCRMLHLDSGTQRHRAHAFYLANGFHINCFHFAQLFDD